MLKAFELFKSDIEVMWDFMATGAAVSCVVAYLTIGWFLKLLNRIGMIPFVWYRLALGIVLFVVFIR